MKQTKKIYRYAERMVSVCKWCKGYGSVMGSWHFKTCTTCKGAGGKWGTVKELVGEEVTE